MPGNGSAEGKDWWGEQEYTQKKQIPVDGRGLGEGEEEEIY